MLNLGSLLLGIVAWVIPLIAMKYPLKKCVKFIIFSLSACIASLCLQLFEIHTRVQIEDWAAIMDTIGTLIWVATILAVITIILNIMSFIVCTKRETEIQ